MRGASSRSSHLSPGLARQNATAVELAYYLEDHPAVARVRYAGLSSHADRNLAKSMFAERGFGALITFDLARDEAGCSRFVDDLSSGTSLTSARWET